MFHYLKYHLFFINIFYFAIQVSTADVVLDADSIGNPAIWEPRSNTITGSSSGIALGGTETVATSVDVTSANTWLRYNTDGSNAALHLTPGSGNWTNLEIRMRLLDGNPGDNGTSPLTWPGATTAVRFSFNENKSNPLVLLANDPNWVVTTEANGWVLLTQDISSLGTNSVIKMRLDMMVSGNATHNYEIDYITLKTSTPPVSTGPNVIFIMVDDMGYSDLGCYGGEIDTPNIDSLAAEGIKFRQFYNNAKCETTRTSLMSGLYHGRGANAAGGATLAEAAKSAGYRTYAVGKWHLGSGSLIPVQQGFDQFYGFYGGFADFFPNGIGTNTIKRDAALGNSFISAYPDSNFNTVSSTVSNQTTFPTGYYLTDGFGDNAVTFIQDAVTNHPDKPFFLYLAFNAPHTPLQAPLALINKYRNNTYLDGWDKLREDKWDRQKALGLVDPKWQLANYRNDTPKWDSLTTAEKDAEDHRRSVYAAMVDSVDQNVGKILQQLTASGIADDTLVIFTSDNGTQAFDNTSDRNSSPSAENSRWSMGPAWAAYSNVPFRYYKQSQHQGGICSSFVARWPDKITPGTITDQPGHIVDIMATLVDIADIDYASLTKNNGSAVPPMDGKSLLPIFEGNTRPAPNFWGFEFGNSEFAVIKGDWKLVAFSSSPWRLYNLKDDRTETQNLRWQNPAKVTELAALYDQWAIDTYGNNSRTYTERDIRSELSQELRYLKVLGGGLFKNPGIDITLSNIGGGTAASINDHWEHYLTNTSASGVTAASDSVTFANKRFLGDGSLNAQVESMSNMTSSGQAGIMIRNSVAEDSAFFMLGITPGGDLIQSMRNATGAQAQSSTLVSGLTQPIFLKISRADNVFTPSYSTDGQAWVDLPNTTLPIAIDALGGLAASSGSNSTRGTVTFREWETNDISIYPHRLRSIDGLSAYLAYSFGAGLDTNALPTLPRLVLGEAGGNVYPEFLYQRRIGIPPAKFIVRWLGEDLTLREDDTINWPTIETSPNPDGISESVRLRRNTDITTDDSGFYLMEVSE